jgi:3',5'-cyclic AMP phosphodiesterase CpdA
MGLILHVTDLHLGMGGASMTTADEKVQIVPKADLDTRVSEAKDVFERIRKKLDRRKFDAVVVSGDITVANAEGGYAELKGFLTSLGSCLPARQEAIVVVPGNHDVAGALHRDQRIATSFFCSMFGMD